MNEVLSEKEWRELTALHHQRATRWTTPARRRHTRGTPHPVEDFLFTYYPFSLSKLETWHPSFGTALDLTGDDFPHFHRSPYHRQGSRVFADSGMLSIKARTRLVWIRELLNQTRQRSPVFNCHGLHEWAMVYRGSEVRHKTSSPLRLPQSKIDRLVETRPIACTHFDAFRFFHPDAQKLNRVQPSLESRPDFEQPGCVHANMDLYKWASKAMPWIGSNLHLDCFELAVRLRELDMRASPYDLKEYGLEAITIETPSGRREYEEIQKKLSSEAQPLREKLIGALDRVLTAD